MKINLDNPIKCSKLPTLQDTEISYQQRLNTLVKINLNRIKKEIAHKKNVICFNEQIILF